MQEETIGTRWWSKAWVEAKSVNLLVPTCACWSNTVYLVSADVITNCYHFKTVYPFILIEVIFDKNTSKNIVVRGEII